MWTQQPPTEGDWYWHWDGDEDSAPLPTCVMFSGTSGKCFVSIGQLGISEAIDCDKYGGWWSRCCCPSLPGTVQDHPQVPVFSAASVEEQFRSALLDDERILESLAVLKVGKDMQPQTQHDSIEVFRRGIAAFVKSVLEELGVCAA